MKALTAFCALVFTNSILVQESQAPETWSKVWSKENLPLVEVEQFREVKNSSNTCRTMGPDRMHSQVLKELIDIPAKPQLVIFKWLQQQGEVREGWKKANVTVAFKNGRQEDTRYHRLVSLASLPLKMMKVIVLETPEDQEGDWD